MTSTIQRFYAFTTLVAAIGAINWGLVGIFNWNLVAALAGGSLTHDASVMSRAVYAVVGLSGLLTIGAALMLWVEPPERHETSHN